MQFKIDEYRVVNIHFLLRNLAGSKKSTVDKWNYQILCLHPVTVGQKVPILDFQSEFSMSKIIQIFLGFFSLNNMNSGAHFLFVTFFDDINFKSLYYLKWQLADTPIIKIQ